MMTKHSLPIKPETYVLNVLQKRVYQTSDEICKRIMALDLNLKRDEVTKHLDNLVTHGFATSRRRELSTMQEYARQHNNPSYVDSMSQLLESVESAFDPKRAS